MQRAGQEFRTETPREVEPGVSPAVAMRGFDWSLPCGCPSATTGWSAG